MQNVREFFMLNHVYTTCIKIQIQLMLNKTLHMCVHFKSIYKFSFSGARRSLVLRLNEGVSITVSFVLGGSLGTSTVGTVPSTSISWD